MLSEADLERFLHRLWEEQRRGRYLLPEDPRHTLARRVERAVIQRLIGRGHQVSKAAPNEHWDLWADGIRIEVKAATWHGRYQANLRGNDADVLILGCVNGDVHFFVIPFDRLEGRRHVAIWSPDPARYLGRWAPFYEAWEWLDALEVRNPWQLPLFPLPEEWGGAR